MTDLRLEPIRRPALATMVPVPAARLAEAHGGEQLAEHLLALRLSCYQDSGQRFWFGQDAPDFPDHDRWLATVSMQDFVLANRNWQQANYSNVLSCGELITTGPAATINLVAAFEDLAKEFSMAMMLFWDPQQVVCRNVYRQQERKRREILQAFNTFYYDGLAEAIAMLPWDQEMHDLIRHYDRWLARHPEATGMPRDIVLRMHGLSTYAEACAAGKDWLDTRVALELAP